MNRQISLFFWIGLIPFFSFLTSCNSRSSDIYYDVSFPVEFIPFSGLPRTEVEIENHSYSLMIDLGSSSPLCLNSEILNTINKKPLKTTYMVDIKGNKHKTEVYLIPEIRIRKMKVTKVPVDEESYDLITEGAVLTNFHKRSKEDIAREKPGRIGRALFENNTNLFLDFYNSVMYGCSSLVNRKKNGYQINKMIQIPFELSRKSGIILEAQTDLGIKKFILDTGASRNILKPSILQGQISEDRVHKSSQFILGEKDFGPQEFFLFEIAPTFNNIDGIIGMDFLKNHVVYLDFKKKIAHVGKASEVSSNIRVPSYVKSEKFF